MTVCEEEEVAVVAACGVREWGADNRVGVLKESVVAVVLRVPQRVGVCELHPLLGTTTAHSPQPDQLRVHTDQT